MPVHRYHPDPSRPDPSDSLLTTDGRRLWVPSAIIRVGQRLEGHVFGCWLWPGASSSSGYPQISHENRKVYVYKLVYEHVRGAVPRGLELDHLCRTPRCCNPWHLEAVTHAENMRRASHIFTTGTCRKGHPVVGPDADVVPTRTGKLRCRQCARDSKARRREQAA